MCRGTWRASFNLIVSRLSRIKPFVAQSVSIFFSGKKRKIASLQTIRRSDFCSSVKADEAQVCRKTKKKERQKRQPEYFISKGGKSALTR